MVGVLYRLQHPPMEPLLVALADHRLRGVEKHHVHHRRLRQRVRRREIVVSVAFHRSPGALDGRGGGHRQMTGTAKSREPGFELLHLDDRARTHRRDPEPPESSEVDEAGQARAFQHQRHRARLIAGRAALDPQTAGHRRFDRLHRDGNVLALQQVQPQLSAGTEPIHRRLEHIVVQRHPPGTGGRPRIWPWGRGRGEGARLRQQQPWKSFWRLRPGVETGGDENASHPDQREQGQVLGQGPNALKQS